MYLLTDLFPANVFGPSHPPTGFEVSSDALSCPFVKFRELAVTRLQYGLNFIFRLFRDGH